MAGARDRPYVEFNFVVNWGTGETDGLSAGFCRRPGRRSGYTSHLGAAARQHRHGQLLEADFRTPVTTWRFSQARPLLLAHSPLDALHGGVLMETLTLGLVSMTLR